MTPRIRVADLVKRFGSVTAVDNISFDVGEGEFISLLGPSGCGKTTTLRCIGGYEKPSGGTIEIAGRIVNDVPVHRRDIGMVFQNYALFPHKKVRDNVAFALKMRGVRKAERYERAREALDLVEMAKFEDRYPAQLSAGQRQRIALARALIHRPSVLLLDEPLANLDRQLRENMRVEIKLIQERVKISAILVTHDQEEALVTSDRIAVMEGGRIHQIAGPGEIYNRPATGFVARFIGETNFFAGTVCSLEGGTAKIRVDDGDITLSADGLTLGAEVGVSIRPERIEIDRQLPAGAVNGFAGVVEFVTYLGSTATYRVSIAGGTRINVMKPIVAEAPPFVEGDRVSIWWPRDRGRIVG